MASAQVIHADCLDWMKDQPDNCVDLVFCSPPYEAARTYGIDFKLRGQAWVDWSAERFIECVRISRGLVAWVLEGQTRQYRWSAVPALLMADLHRAGVHLRKPPAFARVGIPGSGGPDWLRNDWEFIVCGTGGGRLPWSNNVAMGHPPKWAPGGAMSHRVSDGSRVNQWGHPIDSGATVTKKGGVVRSKGKRPSSHQVQNHGINGHGQPGAKGGTKTDRRVMTRTRRGSRDNGGYNVPVLANPGNIIKVIVGGGVMGSALSHENEAPFPEKLAEFFVLSFCPPDGTVLDIFSGSGTTAAVALKHGRNAIAVDVRESQVELTKKRIKEVQPVLF